ncbi:MAG: hypothetical protein H8E34_10130 [Bacteroidetes bacterium]|nr:hypothetical protein [Bacteroidota bacterium]MBL6944508.1 hypothetical protein [Bacteroidales bacterium]
MNDFLKKVLKGNGISPSRVCLQAFNHNFENAVNVEWYNKKNYLEAIFYKDNIEHIAIFNLNGNLIEYKLFLPEGYLPASIIKIVEAKGEIMNAVMRNKGNMVEYEIIVRDGKLNRHLITLSDIGILIEEKIL